MHQYRVYNYIHMCLTEIQKMNYTCQKHLLTYWCHKKIIKMIFYIFKKVLVFLLGTHSKLRLHPFSIFHQIHHYQVKLCWTQCTLISLRCHIYIFKNSIYIFNLANFCWFNLYKKISSVESIPLLTWNDVRTCVKAFS